MDRADSSGRPSCRRRHVSGVALGCGAAFGICRNEPTGEGPRALDGGDPSLHPAHHCRRGHRQAEAAAAPPPPPAPSRRSRAIVAARPAPPPPPKPAHRRLPIIKATSTRCSPISTPSLRRSQRPCVPPPPPVTPAAPDILDLTEAMATPAPRRSAPRRSAPSTPRPTCSSPMRAPETRPSREPARCRRRHASDYQGADVEHDPVGGR